MLKLNDPLPALPQQVLSPATSVAIDGMEVYCFDRRFIEASWPSGELRPEGPYGLMKIGAGGRAGFAEYALPAVKPYDNLVQWASVFMRLKGLSLNDAMRLLDERKSAWGQARAALAEAALTDLSVSLSSPLPRPEAFDPWLRRDALIERSQAYFSF